MTKIGFAFLLMMEPMAGLSESQRALAAQALRIHEATMARLASFSCKFSIEVSAAPPRFRQHSGEYHRRERLVLIDQRDAHGTLRRSLLRDGTLTVLALNDDGISYTAVKAIPEQRFSECDVWENHLLAVTSRSSLAKPLAELIESEVLSWTNVRETINSGRNLIVFEMVLKPDPSENKKRSVEIHLSPEHGYLIQRVRHSIVGPLATIETEREAGSFMQIDVGTFFPVEAKFTSKSNGKPLQVTTSRVSDIQLRKAEGDALFNISIPKGTRVFDKIKNESYSVDENGQPMGPVKPMDARAVPLPASLPATPPPPPAAGWPWPWWLLATLPLAGLAWWLWRRWLAA